MAAQSPIDATSLPHPRHPEPTSPHKPLRAKRTHFHFPTPAPPPPSRCEEPPLRAHANSPAEPVPAPARPQTAIYQTTHFTLAAAVRPLLVSATYAGFLESACDHHKPILDALPPPTPPHHSVILNFQEGPPCAPFSSA